MTVVAYKGKQGPCLERNQAVVYKGPFKQVEDDDGHLFRRGERTAVCDKTFRLLARAPYTGQFEAIEPRTEVPLALAQSFDCRVNRQRSPRETKGFDYQLTTEATPPSCGVDGNCC